MKHKSLLLALPVLLSLTSCGPTNVEFNEEGDKYVDKMPVATKDGAILHCFDWTYNSIKDNIETIAANGFKSVQVSPVQQPKSGGAQWWAYYQPLSLSVAESTPLGTKADLKALCDEAEKYDVSVIADIVVNHLGNKGDKNKEADGTPTVAPEVENYEPEIYALRNDATNPTFHHNLDAKGSGAITQSYPFGNLPDLNTAHPLVQEKVLGLLKECIDLGIDGFRFDAAKHIETPTDPEYASDFWPNTLGVAKTYYKEKTGNDLFAYGEVLNDPEGGRNVKDYTDLMYVTDSGYIGSQLVKFIQAKGEDLAAAQYNKNTDPENLVTWIESHDTYVESDNHQKITRVRKMWATLASRKGSRGLFFARPDANNTVGKIGDYSFEDETIAVANRFHNRFIGAEELQYGEGQFYVNQRFDENQTGAVIIGLGKDKEFKTTNLKKLNSGLYFDQVSGQQVKVVNGKAEFTLGETGVAILTQTNNLPRPEVTLSEREGGFVGEKTIKVTTKNAVSASYTINGGTPVTFIDTADIIIGKDVDQNKEVRIEVTATNGTYETKRHATFKQIDLIEGGFNVANFNTSYFDKYEVYLWKWNDSTKKSTWCKDYEMSGTTMLVSVEGIDGFLIGLFPKGYEITKLDAWDSKIIKQSNDIKGNDLKLGFYDAAEF